MAKRLLVEIVGDASSLERSFGRVGNAANSLGGHFGRLAKDAALVVGGAAIGGLAVVLDKSVHAALDAQASQAKLDTALKATHQSVTKMTPALEAAMSAARRFGFEDNSTREALAKLEIATGNTKTAVTDLGVAEDIARFKHIDLTGASQMLAMAMTGSQRAAKQLGITVSPVTENLDKLKASTVDLTTVQGKSLEAHAKLLDKMATGKAIIGEVTDKLHGQAKAFSETAAGGIAQFQAQLQHMEEGLGEKLLPLLATVLDWVNSHWPQISAVFSTVFNAVGSAITSLQPVWDWLANAFVSIYTWTVANWPQISGVFVAAFDIMKGAILAIVDVGKSLLTFYEKNTTLVQVLGAMVAGAVVGFTAYAAVMAVVRTATLAWAAAQAILDAVLEANPIGLVVVAIAALVAGLTVLYTKSATFRAIVGGAWDAVKSIVVAAFNIIKGVIEAFIDLITGHWSAAWHDIESTVRDVMGAIPKTITSAVSSAANAALSLGKSVVNGIVHGLANLGQRVVSALAAVGAALIRAAVDAGSEAVQIGEAIVNGIINGIGDLAGRVGSWIGNQLKGAVNIGKSIIRAFSPSKLTAEQLGQPMGEGVIVGWVEGTAALPSKMAQSMQDAITKARQVVSDARATFQTAFGDLASIADQAFSSIGSSKKTPAERMLAGLTGKHDRAAFTAQMAQAQADLQAAQTAKDPVAILAAQKAINDLQYQDTVAWLTKRAAYERQQEDARNAVRQIGFDKAMAQLQDHIAKGHLTYKQAMADILELLKKYGIHFEGVGRAMGIAWIKGLKDAITEAAKTGGNISQAIKNQAGDIKVPKAATGGYVAQSGLAVIHRGEWIDNGRNTPRGGLTIMPGAIQINGVADANTGRLVVEAITAYEYANGARYAKATG